VSRFRFVSDHRDAFEVKWLCEVMQIARSSFYAWCAAADGRDARAAADEALAERVNHKRVARMMRGAGIAGYRRKRRVKTTTPDPASQKVPDPLNRDFTAEA
jgi:transposase InsO family protein